MPLKYRVEMSEQKSLARGLLGDLSGQRRGKVAHTLSLIGERTLQNEKVHISPQPDNVFAVVCIPGISKGSTCSLSTESYAWRGMGHGQSLHFEIREGKPAPLDLMEEERIGFGFDPVAKNSVEPVIESLQAMRADYMKGERPSKINRVIHGEKVGDEIGNVVRMKMGEAEIIDLAIIQAQPDHLPKRPAPSIKKNKVRIQGQC